jgi:hypothetical protein
MARAYMEARLIRLHRALTNGVPSPFENVPNWTKYRRLFKFQAFVRARFNRLDPKHHDIMEDYYGLGKQVSGANNVALVEIRKAFRAQLTAAEVARLKGWVDVPA